MLDFFRNLTKSKEEKDQEAISAYLDNILTPTQRLKVEQKIAQDPKLRADLAQFQSLHRELGQLPRRRVPRNFTLDPALYGRPQSEPLVKAYPVLRTATVLAAFFFVFALSANIFLSGLSLRSAEMAEPIAMEAVQESAIIAEDRVAESAPIEEPAEEAFDAALEMEESAPGGEMNQFAPAEEPAAKEPLDSLEFEQMPMDEQTQEMITAVAPEILSTSQAEMEGLLPLPTQVFDQELTPEMADETAVAEAPLDRIVESEQADAVDAGDQIQGPMPASPEPAQSSWVGVLLLISGLGLFVLLALTLVARQRF